MKRTANKIVRAFKKATGYSLNDIDGKYEYSGYLDLRGTAITSMIRTPCVREILYKLIR